jgi:hypothetical protein
MNVLKKNEACRILQVKPHTLKNLTKTKKIIEINNNLVSLESVLEYQKELEERRSIGSSVWINAGGYGSI